MYKNTLKDNIMNGYIVSELRLKENILVTMYLKWNKKLFISYNVSVMRLLRFIYYSDG